MKNISIIKFIPFALALSFSDAYAYNNKDVHLFEETGQCFNCDLEDYEFSSISWYAEDGLNLSGSNLVRSKFAGYFKNINLSHTNLQYANVHISLNLCPDESYCFANITNADLSNSVFMGQIHFADFTGSKLININKVSSYNEEANSSSNGHIIRIFATQSNFTDVNFTNARISNSAFTYCDFTNADFTGADLRKTSFADSKITIEQIKKAADICEVELPNGEKVVGRKQIDGTIKNCEGYTNLDMFKKGITIL